MGVRRVDLTTDEVEYDSSRELPRPDPTDKDFVPPYEYIEREPRLEEIRPEEQWINPLRPDKLEKIVLDDEALEKLREIIGNYNGWDEENQ